MGLPDSFLRSIFPCVLIGTKYFQPEAYPACASSKLCQNNFPTFQNIFSTCHISFSPCQNSFPTKWGGGMVPQKIKKKRDRHTHRTFLLHINYHPHHSYYHHHHHHRYYMSASFCCGHIRSRFLNI